MQTQQARLRANPVLRASMAPLQALRLALAAVQASSKTPKRKPCAKTVRRVSTAMCLQLLAHRAPRASTRQHLQALVQPAMQVGSRLRREQRSAQLVPQAPIALRYVLNMNMP